MYNINMRNYKILYKIEIVNAIKNINIINYTYNF